MHYAITQCQWSMGVSISHRLDFRDSSEWLTVNRVFLFLVKHVNKYFLKS